MKKTLFIAALAIAALASCSENDFVGDTPSPNSNNDVGAISFGSKSRAITRAEGAAAAAMLYGNFVVEGIKTVDSSPVEVFDNYNVNWGENTADKTLSNTSNWEYVGQTLIGDNKTDVHEQTIKYWDFAASQYDFWAYSLGGGSATVTSLNHNATLTSEAYIITGSEEDLAKVYISDLQTAYNPVKSVSGLDENQSAPFEMGNEVDLTFRSLVSKVRIGLYETIPGYSVREVQFYPSSADNATATDNATLFASSEVLPTFKNSSAQYKVYFPNIGKANIGNSDYNKAHVTVVDEGVSKTSTVTFGTLSYGPHQDGKWETTGYTAANGNASATWTNIWVQRSAATVTWAKKSGENVNAGDYSIVLPYETGAVLTLKIDYILESIDGTGETITVHGATAIVPSQYTQWKPNYAYTYLFKISDNTNGLTNKTVTNKEGLYPITLDAIVVGSEENTQETITTVATPSITTYSITSNVITNNEYTSSDDIYVTATTNGTLQSMTTETAKIYAITKNDAAYAATEAEVLDALNTYTSFANGTCTGRSGLTLTTVNTTPDLSVTSIPFADGNSETVTAGQVALIANGTLTDGNYYAFVFETSTGSTTPMYQAKTLESGDDPTDYWVRTGGEGTTASPYTYRKATNSEAAGTIYYEQYTSSTATYAIKVIKMKDVQQQSGNGGGNANP